jgi:hypothetical protein
LPDDASERLRKLLATVHDEAEQLLVTNEVYDVHGYAWRDQDRSNTEYIGHAMWELTPPFQHDWMGLQRGGTITYEPTERDEALLRSGEDFIGSMEFARRSLGMALCYAAVARPKSYIIEHREFWHEYATTLQWLNIASDRLRDYFLVARFGQTEDEYKKKKKKSYYAAPFEEPMQGEKDNIRKLLDELSSIAAELQRHRDDRNSIVHDVATQAAQASITILREQRELAKKGKTTPAPDWTYEDLQAHISRIPDDPVSKEVANMKLWYTRLVKAGSLVFEFEYWNRQKTR